MMIAAAVWIIAICDVLRCITLVFEISIAKHNKIENDTLRKEYIRTLMKVGEKKSCK